MQRPLARQPLSTALRASAAQIRMQSADGAEGEGARRSGVSKGQLVDAISLRAGVSKKTAELVLSAGAACLHSTRRLRTRHRACRARAHLACLHRARLRSTRPVLPHASAEGRAPPCTAALDVIVETVANGDKVTLVNFGTFDSKRREAREGRNPQTNKPMHIPGTCCPGGPELGVGRGAPQLTRAPTARSFDGADVQVRQDVQGDSEGQCEEARLSLSCSRHFMTCDTAWTCECSRCKCDINDQDHTLYICVRVTE